MSKQSSLIKKKGDDEGSGMREESIIKNSQSHQNFDIETSIFQEIQQKPAQLSSIIVNSEIAQMTPQNFQSQVNAPNNNNQYAHIDTPFGNPNASVIKNDFISKNNSKNQNYFFNDSTMNNLIFEQNQQGARQNTTQFSTPIYNPNYSHIQFSTPNLIPQRDPEEMIVEKPAEPQFQSGLQRQTTFEYNQTLTQFLFEGYDLDLQTMEDESLGNQACNGTHQNIQPNPVYSSCCNRESVDGNAKTIADSIPNVNRPNNRYNDQNGDDQNWRRQFDKKPNQYKNEDLSVKPANVEIFEGSTKETEKRGCRCAKTKCLKKYCECYKAGVLCTALCDCNGCANIEDNLKEIEKLREAFQINKKANTEFCNCKRSFCENNYCPCLRSGRGCLPGCACYHC